MFVLLVLLCRTSGCWRLVRRDIDVRVDERLRFFTKVGCSFTFDFTCLLFDLFIVLSGRLILLGLAYIVCFQIEIVAVLLTWWMDLRIVVRPELTVKQATSRVVFHDELCGVDLSWRPTSRLPALLRGKNLEERGSGVL